MIGVGVLVSGRGSNLQALIADAAESGAPYRLNLVASNRATAAALERATQAGIATALFERTRYASRQEQQRAILQSLRDHNCELVVAAGYDQILEREIIEAFPERIINIHPSLLPAFAGTLHAQAEALAHGVKIAGCTVHLVTPEVDSGPILAQASVEVYDSDTVDSLSARILAQEHQLLPQVVRWMACGEIAVSGRRTHRLGVPLSPASQAAPTLREQRSAMNR